MNTLGFVAVLTVAALTKAAPGGFHGAVVSGPAGVVTNHGAIGPAGHGLGLGGLLGGHGAGGAYLGGPVAGPALVAGPVAAPAAIVGPAVSHAAIVGPTGYGGHGLGLGLGLGLGYGGHGLGLAPGVAVTNGGGVIGLGHHGVSVKGPATVPATIAGPAGKIVADGLYGVPTHGHYGHGW